MSRGPAPPPHPLPPLSRQSPPHPAASLGESEAGRLCPVCPEGSLCCLLGSLGAAGPGRAGPYNRSPDPAPVSLGRDSALPSLHPAGPGRVPQGRRRRRGHRVKFVPHRRPSRLRLRRAASINLAAFAPAGVPAVCERRWGYDSSQAVTTASDGMRGWKKAWHRYCACVHACPARLSTRWLGYQNGWETCTDPLTTARMAGRIIANAGFIFYSVIRNFFRNNSTGKVLSLK